MNYLKYDIFTSFLWAYRCCFLLIAAVLFKMLLSIFGFLCNIICLGLPPFPRNQCKFNFSADRLLQHPLEEVRKRTVRKMILLAQEITLEMMMKTWFLDLVGNPYMPVLTKTKP